MLEKDWTFWLMMTNYALALVTVLALALVAVSVGWELLIRKPQRAELKGRDWNSIAADWKAMLQADPHGLDIPGLGFTMADGGERLDSPEPSKKEADKE